MALRNIGRVAVVTSLAFGLAACGGGGGTGTLQSIAVTAPSATLAVGASEQFTATGYYADANGTYSSQDITGSVNWSSLNPAAATINSKGLATGVAPGQSSIMAQSGGIRSIFVLTVQ